MACGPIASNEMREIEETRLLILGSVQYYPFFVFEMRHGLQPEQHI